MRVNISVDVDFLKEIDKAAARWHLSRSAYISACCSYCIKSLEVIKNGSDEQA